MGFKTDKKCVLCEVKKTEPISTIQLKFNAERGDPGSFPG